MDSVFFYTPCILQKQNIRVATKPLKTLQRMFPSPKQQIAPEQRTNVVYIIIYLPCSDCPWSYVGETGTSFETRKKEHIRSVKNCKKGSNIARHAWDLDHRIDFNNGKVIDSGNYRTRKTLESWHTAVITIILTITLSRFQNNMLRLFAKHVIANYFLINIAFHRTTCK